MHPGQPALDPEPGLIELRYRAGGDLIVSLFQEPLQAPGSAGGQCGDRSGGDRDAGQLGQRLLGAHSAAPPGQ
jgi:hypothetical protein